ncbi:hypothetical protein Pst134EA_027881 [Puccinia striiformis f. sp. tritici]|uniref:hypothetical protein n=1 Tax=Puccinia striiformis f. sp. tritici TaxID=168172 RepID=UPI002008778C|nr:hypothetical protein Pst134EA_027881 [Puccinia striiformis f. sp. tritici]KAH9448572.1 hypothetical protein Pst134EA_027881 [Puccinia striiformis f. sp. tritici]
MGNHRLSLLSTEDREHAMHEMHLSVHDDFCSDPLQQDDQKLDKRSGETLEMLHTPYHIYSPGHSPHSFTHQRRTQHHIYMADQPVTRHRRSASTGSLPALGRKLSSGSLKAVKWIGKQFKSKKAGSSGLELWGTSREAASGKDAKAAKEIEVPKSTLAHRARREALEKHKRDIYSFDWDGGGLPACDEPKPYESVPRPLTTVARGRKRMQSLNATPVSSRPLRHVSSTLDHLPPPVPLRATRLHSLGREDVISTLPRPKPPPVRALPPPPVSLYPIPPTQPLDLSERSRTKSQLKPSNSRRSNESRWGNIYTED